MDTATAVANFLKVQHILKMMSILQPTAHLYPQPALVKDGEKFDFIIVGGGTAGCVITSALAKYNVSVLLVEAGGIPPIESVYPQYFLYPKHTVNDWNVTTEPDKIFQYHKGSVADITQGKMLGGSSGLSYMAYTRGHPSDYDSWAAMTNDSSWSYKSVLPLFRKSERMLDPKILNSPEDKVLYGSNGKIKLIKYYHKILDKYFSAYRELGHKIVVDVDFKNPLGVTTVLFNAGKVERSSTSIYLRSLKKKRNAKVLTNALVTKILFNNEKTAVGVIIKTKDKGIITVKANKEVIITAGAFKTPQLLMVSGIGPKQHLKQKNIKLIKDLPVGQNLQDHPISVSAYKMGTARPATKPPNPHAFPLPATDAHIGIDDKNHPDSEVIGLVIDNPEYFLYICSISFSFTDEVCDTMFKSVKGKQIYFVFNHLAYPKSCGQVLLNTTNMEDQPIIHFNYYSNDDDLEMHTKTTMKVKELLKTKYFRSVEAKFIDPKLESCAGLNKNSKEYWKCYTKSMMLTGHYFVGTCAMGRVLESNLLVKGVQNLRVADASIMPRLIASPTHAAVIMIGQKAALNIVKQHCLK